MDKKKSDAVKAWRKNQIKKGLCRYCHRKAMPGKTMCQYHLDYLKQSKVKL